jgi:hypothetical protein
VGVPDLFVEAYAPADYIETVNTLGLARYLKQEALDFDKGMAFEAQMNCLPICTIPRALVPARVVAYDNGAGALARPPAPPVPARARGA